MSDINREGEMFLGEKTISSLAVDVHGTLCETDENESYKHGSPLQNLFLNERKSSKR